MDFLLKNHVSYILARHTKEQTMNRLTISLAPLVLLGMLVSTESPAPIIGVGNGKSFQPQEKPQEKLEIPIPFIDRFFGLGDDSAKKSTPPSKKK